MRRAMYIAEPHMTPEQLLQYWTIGWPNKAARLLQRSQTSSTAQRVPLFRFTGPCMHQHLAIDPTTRVWLGGVSDRGGFNMHKSM